MPDELQSSVDGAECIFVRSDELSLGRARLSTRRAGLVVGFNVGLLGVWRILVAGRWRSMLHRPPFFDMRRADRDILHAMGRLSDVID